MTLMQKYVRLKQFNADGFCTCCTCGKTGHWKDMQGGHFLSRSHNSVCLLEENIHPQCARCNLTMAGRHFDYTLFMINTYGIEFVEELNQLKNEQKKFTRGELNDLIQELKTGIKELGE